MRFLLFLRTCALALGLSSALPQGLAAAEAPAKKAVVNAADAKEVIQVLAIASSSDIAVAKLIRERSSEPRFLELARAMDKGFGAWLEKFESLAALENIGLSTADLNPTAQLVKLNVDRDVQILAEKSEEEFQRASLDILSYQFQRMITICDQVEQLNESQELKAAVQGFRILIRDLLGEVQAQKAEAQ